MLLLFLAVSAVFGGLDEFLEGETSLLDLREARIGILFAVLAALLPTMQRYAHLGARRGVEGLAPRLAASEAEQAALVEENTALDRRGRSVAGLFGWALLPLSAFLVDRDPFLYLTAEYWTVENIFSWTIGSFVAWNVGCFAYATFVYARRVSGLSERVGIRDLFDLSPLAPATRLGLNLALLWLVIASVFAVNIVDEAFRWVITGITLFAAVPALTAIVLSTRGAQRCIRSLKQAELVRVNEALRGDVSALSDSAIASRGERSVGVADLLAYRSFVASVSEWPFDAPMRLRLVLYLALPLGSWLGGALVERLLSATLD